LNNLVLGDTTEVDNEDVTTRQTEKASGSEETGTTTEISIPGAAASATNSTILQVNVLKELEAIWDYTESVKDPGLKSSLMSLVHFTYARVQSEPEERLDRLKYLLTKLRARLNEAEDS